MSLTRDLIAIEQEYDRKMDRIAAKEKAEKKKTIIFVEGSFNVDSLVFDKSNEHTSIYHVPKDTKITVIDGDVNIVEMTDGTVLRIND